MEGKVWWKARLASLQYERERPWQISLRHLCGCIIFGTLAIFIVLMLFLLQGCATAPTPAFVPVEDFKAEHIERTVLEPQAGDDLPMKGVTVGEAKQPLLDSESLDKAIDVANAAQDDLGKITPEYNRAVKWIYEEIQRNRVGTGVVAGSLVLTAILAFLAGLQF